MPQRLQRICCLERIVYRFLIGLFPFFSLIQKERDDKIYQRQVETSTPAQPQFLLHKTRFETRCGYSDTFTKMPKMVERIMYGSTETLPWNSVSKGALMCTAVSCLNMTVTTHVECHSMRCTGAKECRPTRHGVRVHVPSTTTPAGLFAAWRTPVPTRQRQLIG
jgi:hypothetical protein